MKKKTAKKKPTKKTTKLTDKQKRFCKEYIIDSNAKKAAIRTGYSVKTAESQGSRLLSNVKVKEKIKQLQVKASEKYGISMQRLVDEYKALALTTSADLMEYVDEMVLIEPETDTKPAVYKKVRKAYLKPHSELSEKQRAAIQTIKETNQGVEIKLHDKKGALDSLTKILGGFVDKHEIGGLDGKPIETNFIIEFTKCKKRKG